MRRLLLPLLCAAALAGCDNPQRTADTLRREIAKFKAAPDEKKQTIIEERFAKLELQIAKLEEKGGAKAGVLKDQLADLRDAYQSAKMDKAIHDAKNAIRGFGEALKEGAQSIGDAFKRTNSSD